MPLPDWLQSILPTDTALTWKAIAPIVPDVAYLAGGTAIAVHIHHRESRDLNFFYHHDAIDLDELAAALERTGPFVATERTPGTLNGLFSETKLQVLHADAGQPQRLLEEPALVEGIHVAGLADLMAMKLKVLPQRGELRDYFDLQKIEELTGRTVDEGLGYYIARYQPEDARNQVMAIIRSLGYLDDVDEDDLLPSAKADIAGYWRKRQPEVLKAAGWLASGGNPPPPPSTPVTFLGGSNTGEWVRPHIRGGRKISGYHRRKR